MRYESWLDEPEKEAWHACKQAHVRLRPDVARRQWVRGGNLGASPMLVRYALSPTGRGTELRYQAMWRLRGLMLRLMSPVISVVARRECRRSLARLKKLTEGGAEP